MGVPKLKTISLKTLLLAKEKLPLRTDDRFEHLLERFRVPFDAYRSGNGFYILQRKNLILWMLNGVLHSVELTASYPFRPSDLVNWCGFDFPKGDILAWCEAEGIDLELAGESEESQLYKSPSGAHISLNRGRIWNITLGFG